MGFKKKKKLRNHVMDLNSKLDLSSKSKSIIFLVVPIRFLSQKKNEIEMRKLKKLTLSPK